MRGIAYSTWGEQIVGYAENEEPTGRVGSTRRTTGGHLPNLADPNVDVDLGLTEIVGDDGDTSESLDDQVAESEEDETADEAAQAEADDQADELSVPQDEEVPPDDALDDADPDAWPDDDEPAPYDGPVDQGGSGMPGLPLPAMSSAPGSTAPPASPTSPPSAPPGLFQSLFNRPAVTSPAEAAAQQGPIAPTASPGLFSSSNIFSSLSSASKPAAPAAPAAVQSIVSRLNAGDPKAIQGLKLIASKAATSPGHAAVLRSIATTHAATKLPVRTPIKLPAKPPLKVPTAAMPWGWTPPKVTPKLPVRKPVPAKKPASKVPAGLFKATGGGGFSVNRTASVRIRGDVVMYAGAVPKTVTEILKIALLPAAWTADGAGRLVSWAGTSLETLSRKL